MSSHDDSRVVGLITRHQDEIRAYIVSLLYRWTDAQDVLQETNMILWEKRCTAPRDSEFLPWACRIAYYQVLTYRKRNQRSRLFFSEELIGELAEYAVKGAAVDPSKSKALLQCIESLPSSSRVLLSKRYYTQVPIADIAQEVGRSVSAVSQSLYRIRKGLLDCIRRRVAIEEGVE